MSLSIPCTVGFKLRFETFTVILFREKTPVNIANMLLCVMWCWNVFVFDRSRRPWALLHPGRRLTAGLFPQDGGATHHLRDRGITSTAPVKVRATPENNEQPQNLHEHPTICCVSQYMTMTIKLCEMDRIENSSYDKKQISCWSCEFLKVYLL